MLPEIRDQDQSVEAMHPPSRSKAGDPTPNDDDDDDDDDDDHHDNRSSLGQKRRLEGRDQIVSGMRASATVHIYVDVHRSLQAEDGGGGGGSGIQWWRSDNGVLLTEGHADTGIFPRDLFIRVVDVATGTELWKDGKAVDV